MLPRRSTLIRCCSNVCCWVKWYSIEDTQICRSAQGPVTRTRFSYLRYWINVSPMSWRGINVILTSYAYFLAGTWRWNDVATNSVRHFNYVCPLSWCPAGTWRHHVASTSVWCLFDVMCLLGVTIELRRLQPDNSIMVHQRELIYIVLISNQSVTCRAAFRSR